MKKKRESKCYRVEPRNYRKIDQDLQQAFQITNKRCLTCVHAYKEIDERFYCFDKCKQFARFVHKLYVNCETIWICHDPNHKYFHGQVCQDMVRKKFIVYRCPFLYRLEQEFWLKSTILWNETRILDKFSGMITLIPITIFL